MVNTQCGMYVSSHQEETSTQVIELNLKILSPLKYLFSLTEFCNPLGFSTVDILDFG